MTQLDRETMQKKFKQQLQEEIIRLSEDEEIVNEVSYIYGIDEGLNSGGYIAPTTLYKVKDKYEEIISPYSNTNIGVWKHKLSDYYIVDDESGDEMNKKGFTSFDNVTKDTLGKPKLKVPSQQNRKDPNENKTKLEYHGKIMTIDKTGCRINNFWFEPKQIQMAQYILSIMNEGEVDNILALGESGVGKTEFIKNLGREFGIPVYYLNCAVFRDPTEWFGKEVLRNGENHFELSPMAKMIQNGNCIIIMDELNRTDEFTRGVLLSLFDDTKAINIHDTEIKVGNGTIFYATANIGNGYTGTHTFDIAEFRRFVYINFEKLTQEREQQILTINGATNEIAFAIVNKMNQLREKLEKAIDYDIPFKLTVAKSLQVLRLHKHGMNLKEAFLFAIIEGIPQEAKEAITTIINGNYA